MWSQIMWGFVKLLIKRMMVTGRTKDCLNLAKQKEGNGNYKTIPPIQKGIRILTIGFR